MNSLLQCLSNFTYPSQYFIGDSFKNDLNRSSDTNGEIAIEFAEVVRTLWSGQYKSIAPSGKLKYFKKILFCCDFTRFLISKKNIVSRIQNSKSISRDFQSKKHFVFFQNSNEQSASTMKCFEALTNKMLMSY